MLVHRARFVVFFTFTALVVSMGGCGQRTYGVSGKVTYNNAVLDKPDGQIVFIGPRGEQVDAAIGADGTYQARNVPAGKNRVIVYYINPKLKTEKPTKPRPGEKFKGNPDAYLTPSSYSSPDTSGLSVEVENETVFDVDMKGPAIK